MNINELRRLAGIDYKPEPINNGSNISITGNEKGQLMKKYEIKPGTPEWFKRWFSLPYLTGERPVSERFTPMQIAIMEGGHSLE